MMPNITRGDRAGGLMVYLASEGRHNEHENPHLVAGDSQIMAWHDDTELSRVDALAIAAELDAPRRQLGVEVPGGHVWHCSLSLAADEGQLTDDQWGQIASDFVDEMGFTEASGKAPCRWVAVRHGVSKAGNDHIHVAVSLVREDGTKASVWNDRNTAQRVSGELEVKYGLRVLESRQNGYGIRGVKPAELAQAEKAGTEPVRVTLGRKVRAYGTASVDEAEFVRRCRRGGLLVRPRYASDRTDVVVGYSVAARPPAGEKPVWFGGGNLGRDLTLPRLRSGWPDTPEEHTAAVAEWNAAKRDQRPAAPGREVGEVDPQVWAECLTDVGKLRDRMQSVPVDDTAAWAQLAKETSGVFAAWSIQTEGQPGPLADASMALSRFSQVQAHKVPVKRVPQPGMRQAAMLLMQATSSKSPAASQALFLNTMMQLLKAMHDHQTAVRRHQAARQVEAAVRGSLVRVSETLPPVPVVASAIRDGDRPSATDRFTMPGHAPVAGAVQPIVRPPLPTGRNNSASSTERPTLDPGQGPKRGR
ncbi:relaxase/mobilization nuclease domain-containing protein [Aeromicrobium yanjiei]|uniref:Relaxase n=1 Tax=Aeromicrobium yanjiei TaxID=2662028 RepID=A0A5Q2MFS9_9ACTN|nr:relaxase [Aeromicrobium yanjiei]QGG39902.1 relaxase [Aeromicrobium yanjiei]